MSLRELVFGDGDLVTGWGRVVSDADGVWLDLARIVPAVRLEGERPRSQRWSVRLIGVDLSGVPGASEQGDVIPGALTVTGIWRDMVIEVQSQEAARPTRSSVPHWSEPPCPAPPGGWPRGQRDQTLTFDLGDLCESGAAVTVATFRPTPDQAVLVVAARDAAAVWQVLGPQLPGRLCVVPSRFSREQVDDVQQYIVRHREAWAVEIHGCGPDERAQASFSIDLLRVTEQVADWAETLPAGLLTLTPKVWPAEAI